MSSHATFLPSHIVLGLSLVFFASPFFWNGWLQQEGAKEHFAPSSHLQVPKIVKQPPGYMWLKSEPTFDPATDLALEFPKSMTTLSQLGYTDADIRSKATPFAASAPFRILSDHGARTLLQISRRLKEFAHSSERIDRSTRGGVYRSRWLRDLCTSPELTSHLVAIYGIPIAPHPMGLQLGHINYQPRELGKAIDKWHHDTLPLDFVMMVTDPASLSGGQFEWFNGTKDEAAALRLQGRTPSDVPGRVQRPEFPSGGYAIALHGNMVVHRGAPLDIDGERITMVNGYVALDVTKEDQTRNADLIRVDPPEVLYPEWARFTAWRSASKLQHLIDTLDFTLDQNVVATRLEEAIGDAQRAVEQMRAAPPRNCEHYELPN